MWDEVAAPAPLLIVLGGGDFGEELLLKKLELLIGLSRLAQYEKAAAGRGVSGRVPR